MIILLFIISNIEWYPTEYSPDKEPYEMIVGSKEGRAIIWKHGGNNSLVKVLIHLEGGIFKGGEKILLPRNFKIKETPENLQLIPRAIKTKTYKRYSALYKEGELRDKWERLKKELEDSLKISSLEMVPLNELRENLSTLFPPPIEERVKENKPTEELEDISNFNKDEEEFANVEKDIKIPEEYYFSFILLEENLKEKLIPVILHLSPINKVLKESIKEEEVREEIEKGGER